MPEPTRHAEDWIPLEILNDPRHLVRDCDGCLHMLTEGLCGLDLHPKEVWANAEGCPEYDPLCIEAGGDQNPELFIDYS
ncbi:MAG: hypothetical protein KY468_00045 [Armatimonadetes bacterium]|nr:hypothetical protein [Armatimonadota bacterium]